MLFATKAIIIAAFCLTATLATTRFERCSHDLPAPSRVRFHECKTEPCIIHRASPVTVEWDFRAVSRAEDLKPKLVTTYYNNSRPYVFPEQDGCKGLTIGLCPLAKGEEATFSSTEMLFSEHPKGRVGLKFYMHDSYNIVHMCFRLKAIFEDKK